MPWPLNCHSALLNEAFGSRVLCKSTVTVNQHISHCVKGLRRVNANHLQMTVTATALMIDCLGLHWEVRTGMGPKKGMMRWKNLQASQKTSPRKQIPDNILYCKKFTWLKGKIQIKYLGEQSKTPYHYLTKSGFLSMQRTVHSKNDCSKWTIINKEWTINVKELT